MAKGGGLCSCIVCFCVFCLCMVAAVLISGYCIDVGSVEVTVDEASLDRLTLAAPAANGTASLAYNLSLAVSVRNPNWAVRVWRTAPLDAELRLGGRPFDLVRLAGAEGTTDRIGTGTSKVYRVAAGVESAPVGNDSVAAFARDSAVAVFELELIIAGKFKYQAQGGSSSTTVRCRLKLPLSTVAKAVAIASFEHSLPPQLCLDISNMDISTLQDDQGLRD